MRIIDESKREFIRNALLLKHVHQHEKEFQKQLNNGEKKSLFKKSSNTNMNDMSSERPECELFFLFTIYLVNYFERRSIAAERSIIQSIECGKPAKTNINAAHL